MAKEAQETQLKTSNNQLSAKDIEHLESQHKTKIKVFTIDDIDFAFKQPSRQVMSAANTVVMQSKDPFKQLDVFIDNCLVSDNKQLIEHDDEVYFALLEIVDDLVTTKKATLKKY